MTDPVTGLAVHRGQFSANGRMHGRSARALERMQPDARWVIAVAAICAATGLLAGVNPGYGLMAAVAIVFVAVVITNPTVGLVLFVVLASLDVLRSGGVAGSFTKVAGLLLFGSWLAGAAAKSRRTEATVAQTSPLLVVACVALVTWSTISIAWAQSGGNAATDTYRYLLNMLLIPIVFGTVRRREHVLWIAGAFLFSAVISSGYSFIHPPASAGFYANRAVGTVGDPNEQAAVLVGAIALGFGLIGALRRSPGWRLAAVLGVVLSVAGVFQTLSRSGLIALGVMLLAGLVLAGRWRRWVVLLLGIGGLATIGYFGLIASSTAGQRVISANTSGRSTIWTVGWRMASDNLLTGVGSGNFEVASVRYILQPGSVNRSDLIINTPKVAHNVFLEELADLGIPGLLAFVTVVGACFAAALSAARLFGNSGNRDLELMSRCVLLGIVGFMASDFFLSGQFSKQLWLLLALGPALLGIARRAAAEEALGH